MKTNTHTSGPWKVMPCPKHAGKHAFHDTRWIATHDAELSYGHDSKDESWGLESGSLICEMRDGPSANAHLIAAAPDLILAMEEMLAIFGEHEQYDDESARVITQTRAAIIKAKGAA